MKRFLTWFCTGYWLLITPLVLPAQDDWGAPANSDVAVAEDFNGEDLPSKLKPTVGSWKVSDGVLQGDELPEEKHAAAARYIVSSENAVYQMRFRLSDQTKSFHFGFDPAKGALKKRGHLFSVIVTPNSWKILKHIDKDRPKEDPNETLVEQKTEFEPGTWYQLRVTTWENYVTARIDGKAPIKASHPTFGVRKPTLVFRCQGPGLEVDDLKVWTQKQ